MSLRDTHKSQGENFVMTSNKQPNCSSSLTASYMIILTIDLPLLNCHRNVIVTLTKYPPLIKCYTAVSRKVVLQTGKSLRDNVERYYG